jgi:hypothetical protein
MNQFLNPEEQTMGYSIPKGLGLAPLTPAEYLSRIAKQQASQTSLFAVFVSS